ncbi:MAG: TM2 domain-containing protein [Asgard group archaeon]|jgi:TM2 domain-containing membrane protein YozV|nr:TM2 domain-containing protein [Asgard group archaeon]
MSEKSKDDQKLIDLLLCLLLGGLGIHRFMKGYTLSGILWLCTGGLFTIGWIIDVIYIVTDKEWIIPK